MSSSTPASKTEFFPLIVLRSLVQNEEYCRKVIPFLQKEYFNEQHHVTLFDEISKFVTEYNEVPSKDALIINLSKNPSLRNETVAVETTNAIKFLFKTSESKENVNDAWLFKETERWCQERAIFNAVLRSINIIEDREKDVTTHAIPKILQDALAVSFNSAIGHDYFENYKDRYESYHRVEDKIAFDIDILNKITNGGLPKKILALILAPTGVGKTLILCHLAASSISQSKNVLYITMEMSETMIAKRVDANLMDVTLRSIDEMKFDAFENNFNRLLNKTHGRLIVKEYPTGAAHVGHFRALIEELRIKKNFLPDMIIVDYLGICASSRIKGMGGTINSYSYVKSIAEELRGLAIEYDVPVASAVQTNRCLALDTRVTMADEGIKRIDELKVGDELKGSEGNVKVLHVYEKERQKTYKIKSKWGPWVRCSERHVFPTLNGMNSINHTLSTDDLLFLESVEQDGFRLSRIESIEEYGYEETIDISVSGNNMFYANGILTHNSGIGNSDIDLTNMAESTGISSTADLILSAFVNDELLALNQMMMAQLKNRFGDPSYYAKFLVGLDRSKMKLFNLDDSVNKSNASSYEKPSHVDTNTFDSYGDVSSTSPFDSYDFGSLKA